MDQKDFASSKVFYDNKHFPRGFSRSGIFSKGEASVLERCGFAMKDLVSGVREPCSEVERRFLQVASGELAAENEYEKAWIKYARHVKTKRVFYTAGMTPAVSSAGDTSELDSD